MDKTGIYECIGIRVRRLRKARNLTQEQLAEIAGISASFLGHIERGTRKLSIETLYTIMSALKCSVNDLFGVPLSNDCSKISDHLFDLANQLQKRGQ